MGNIYGGIVAAIIALPLAIAFGIASGLGAEAGIYGAVVLGFFAALFGGTKTQISGPTGPMTVVSATVITAFSENISVVFGVFLLAGLFQILFGLLKFGKFVKFIPYPVISGFMNGIGTIIIILQISVIFGSEIKNSIVNTFISLPNILTNIDITSVVLSVGTLVILFLTPKAVAKKVPPTLIALVILSFIAQFMSLDVAYVSNIPTGLPEFVMPSFDLSLLSFMLTSAITLAILGTIDSLLTSLVADSITKTKHDSNKELIGQGIGNSLAAFMGGIPGAGATMRTVVNIKSGASSNISGMIHAVVLLLILLVFAPYASMIPMPVLAGILVKVGLDILDYKMLKQLKIAPKQDVSIMIIVFILTVFVDLIVAVGAGVVLSSFLIINRLLNQSSVDTNIYEDIDDEHDDRITNEGIRIINIRGPFFFGSISRIIDSVDEVYDVKNIVIDCSRTSFMDLSAVYALSEVIVKIKDTGCDVFIVADGEIRSKLLRLGILEFISRQDIQTTQEKAIQRIITK